MRFKKNTCVLLAIFFTTISVLSSQEQNEKKYLFNAIKDGNYELFTYYIEKKGLGVNCTYEINTNPYSWEATKDTFTPLVYLFFVRPQIYGQEDIAWNYNGEFLSDVYEKMLDYLLKNGANVNYKTKRGYTCVEYFYNQGIDLYIPGNIDWVKKVYDAGFDFSKSKNLGKKILRNQDLKLFYFGINRGIDFSVTLSLNDNQNFEVSNINLIQYAIYLYCYTSRLDLIQTLLQTGQIDINSQDSNGDTALHYAVHLNYPDRVIDSYEHLTWVKFLINNGANPKIKNKKGLTPLDLALKYGENGSASYLLQFE